MRDKSQNRTSATFSEVEEFSEAVRTDGWDVDYRQISKGSFSTGFSALDCMGTSLTSVNFQNDLLVCSESPEGFIGFFLPSLASGEVTMCGTTLTNQELVCFPGGLEMEFVTKGKIENETILVPATEFRAVARALDPLETSPFPKAATIYQSDSLRCAALQRSISTVLGNGGLDAEVVSNLLEMIVLWMTDDSARESAEKLSYGRSVAIARRAQAFIENEYQDMIHMKDLCAHTGVGVRSLQRCFASYFQMSPFEYLKIRRLNEARNALATEDPSVSSVTRIAMRVGFFHLGRFSVEYRAYFGESPRETLARRPP